jgi:hypothetical protein
LFTFYSKKKAGLVLGASILSGLFHSKLTTINRNKIKDENIKDSVVFNVNSNNNIYDPNISKLIDDNTLASSLQDLLLNLEITTYVCLSMLILLMIQILFKIHFKDIIILNYR